MAPMAEAARREIMQCRGHFPALLGEVEKLSPEAQRQLLQFVRNLKGDLRDAERTFRPFPGGPRMRM